MGEKRETLTIMLFKDSVKGFAECLKNDIDERVVTRYMVEPRSGLEGEIVVEKTKGHYPKWKGFLQTFTNETVELNPNKSNRAVMLVKIDDRFFAVIFGYGKSLINLDKIEPGFGFKTALSIIDYERIRSVNLATIDSMVMSTQHQTPYYTNGGEFDIANANDILTSISGRCSEEELGQMVDGKDSLRVSVDMNPMELAEKIRSYYSAYQGEGYKGKYPWIDNMEKLSDKHLVKQLDDMLIKKLLDKEFSNIIISPPSTIDWGEIKGFMLTGFGKRDDIENYREEIDVEEYFAGCKNLTKELLCSRVLKAAYIDDETRPLCPLYRAFVAEIEWQNNQYVLFDGKWYKIDNSFYEKVLRYVEGINISDITLPECPQGLTEGEYNLMVADNFEEFALIDKKLASVTYGPKQIEPCDLLTKNKSFLHVKKETRSSMLSHLFSQGRVAAISFLEDEEFRACTYESAVQKFDDLDKRSFIRRPDADEMEIVYVIIASKKKCDKGIRALPFFSLVNLMLVHQGLMRMRVRCSIKFVGEC